MLRSKPYDTFQTGELTDKKIREYRLAGFYGKHEQQRALDMQEALETLARLKKLSKRSVSKPSTRLPKFNPLDYL